MMTGLRQKKPSGLLVMQLMGRIPMPLFLWFVYCSPCMLLLSSDFLYYFIKHSLKILQNLDKVHSQGTLFLPIYASYNFNENGCQYSDCVFYSCYIHYHFHYHHYYTILISFACFTLARETGTTLLQFAMRKEIPSWKLPIWKKPRNSIQEYDFSVFPCFF